MTDLTHPIFTDADIARAHLESMRWPDGVVCAHCGSTDGIVAVEGKKKSHRKGLYFCNHCKGQFTVTVGTVMEQSHVPLNKWLLAFYLMCASKKGYSAHQLHRTIAVSYKTAWFMAHRIREAMRSGGLAAPLGSAGGSGIVEADETFIGTKKGVRKGKGGARHKNAVLSLVERGGKVRSVHVDDVKAITIVPIVNDNIAREARVMTDAAATYYGKLGNFTSHEAVNHAAKEYVRGDVHTNTVEGYFSVFKRGMKGVYQHCSEKHLHRYLAEFDFRYNNRSALGVEDSQRTANALGQIEGKRLKYRPAHEA